MGWVTKGQIERARQISVLEYVLAYEAGNIKRVGNGYRLKDHESLAISEKGFYWHSRGVGGKTALDYLTDVRGYGLVEAVSMLTGERPQERPDWMDMQPAGIAAKLKEKTPDQKTTPGARAPPQNTAFTMPIRYKDNNRVIAYLQSRGIDRDLVMNCIQRGVLFESFPYHSCVFIGKDERGKARYAALRGTTTNFKRDADGSDKRYGFVLLPGNQGSGDVAAFESPVDCLSHQSLCKHGFIPSYDGWRLSLGGTSIVALEHFIKMHPEVTHCLICTDNDAAGDRAAVNLAAMPGITSVRLPPLVGSDWNDALLSMQKSERSQNRTRHDAMPSY